jgi:acyl carrier protein
MTRRSIKKRDLFLWLETIFEEPAGSIDERRDRRSIPNWDSMGTLLLIAELDEKLDVMLDADELAGLTSVTDLLATLRSRDIALEDG